MLELQLFYQFLVRLDAPDVPCDDGGGRIVPAAPMLLPGRRALLSRNPTPWSSPEMQTLPLQVQRHLQQIAGGSSYRTYQPFQIVEPLITPLTPVKFDEPSRRIIYCVRGVSESGALA
jgi:hypothetical protein